MVAQHQHYVPRLLLRGFLSHDHKKSSKNQVHVLDLETGKKFTASIDNIMGERRFNDFWVDEENLATIEPAVGRIESHVAPLIRRIRREKYLERTPEETGNLATLLAFQFIRTKKMRLLPASINEQLAAHVRKLGFDPGEVEGLETLDEETLKRQHVSHQVRSLTEYSRIIADKEFFLMVAPAGSSFYVSDHPVILHNDEDRRGAMSGLGLAVHYIQIYLPLSAEVMLCAYDKAIFGRLMQSNEEEIKKIRADALGRLIREEITAAQMKKALDNIKAFDFTTPFIKAIREGQPIAVGREQVQFYNSIQTFQAQRFVIDPHGSFWVAEKMIPERKKAGVSQGVAIF
jgi:hypothetical protein